MELVYAALLLHKSGKEINSDNLKKVMTAAGAQVDDSKIRALVAALEGVDIDKAIIELEKNAPTLAVVFTKCVETVNRYKMTTLV